MGLVYNGTAGALQRMLFYVDGTPVAASVVGGMDNGGALENNALTLKIGIKGDATGTPFYGRIDELEIVGRAMNEAEIAAICNAGSVGQCVTVVTLAPIGNKTVAEGSLLSFTLSGSDPGGHGVTYAAESLPAGANLDEAGGNFSWTPSYDQAGSYPVTFSVTDGAHTVTETITIAVSNTNRLPVAGDQSVSTAEDVARAITLGATDPDGGALTFSVVTGPAHGGMSGAAPNVVYMPALNYNGSDTFTFKANDGLADSNVATVTITVTPMNDAPTLTALSPLTINEDAGLQTVGLSGISAGGGESQTLTVTATSSNTGLIPNPTVTYANPGATGSLGLTPVANTSGMATITVTVNDGQAVNNTAVQTFLVTVTAVNDTPTLTALSPLTINEDSGLQTVGLGGISAGGGEIQALTVTATSSNTDLIPNPTVTYASPNATGSLGFAPMTNANGTATITVTVNDSQAAKNTAVQTFLVTVKAVNDPPTLEAIGSVTINQDAGVQTVGLSGIAAGGGENQTLTVAAVSSNPGLIPNPTVTYSSPEMTGSLAFTSMVNAVGTATITVIVDDGEAAANSIVQTFLVTVGPFPYVLWTRSDSGRASLWQVDPSLSTGPSQLKRSVNLYSASGIGAPWQASSYTHVSVTEGYVLWTRSDNGRAVLWQIDPSLPTGPSQIKRAVSIYSASGIGALWQASSYTPVSATEGYVLWTRSDNGRAALWQIDPSLPTGPAQLKRSVNLYSASGIGAPWQATSYTHLSATEGYVLWARSDNGKAALWQIDPSLPVGPSQLKRSVLLYSASGIGAPWLATSYTHVSATEGFVLWTRSDSGRASLWQIDPSLPTGPSQLKRSVLLYSASGVGAPWQATAFAIPGGLTNGAGADVLDTNYHAGQVIDTPSSDDALADSMDGVMVP